MSKDGTLTLALESDLVESWKLRAPVVALSPHDDDVAGRVVNDLRTDRAE